MKMRSKVFVAIFAVLLGWSFAAAAFFRGGPSVGESAVFVLVTLGPAALILWAGFAAQRQRAARRQSQRVSHD